MEHLADVASKWEAGPASRHNIPWNKGVLLRFFGVLVHMACFPLPNMEFHWKFPSRYPAAAEKGRSNLKQVLRQVVFNKYWQLICLPGTEEAINDNEYNESSKSPTYQKVLELIKTCNATWQAAWYAGEYLTGDESMIFWTGKGEMVVIHMPRKPTPYGIEMHTTACAQAKIILFAEAVEGKEIDALKKYRDVTTATTATTLRMLEAWAGTGRTAIMDAWFGSCNTAEFLQDLLGLHCILAVKTGHRGFPKQQLIEKIKHQRFASAFMKIDVQLDKGKTTFYAGGHMDKKPMLLIATCGTSLPGKEVKRYRREYVDQAIQRTTYVVAQPNMHDLYRTNFNAVDLFNRSCFGPYTLQFAVNTKSWVRRMFLAMLGMCETNAMNAYIYTTK